jgi:MATE family multidrug resistance protein
MRRMTSSRVPPWSGARTEITRLAGLAWPVTVAYIGTVLMGTVDTIMAGRLGAQALAAVALGATWHIAVGIVAFGAARAIDPVVSQAFGAGDRRAVSAALRHGLAMGAVLSLPLMALLALAAPGLRILGQSEELVPVAARYCAILVAGAPALLGFMILRQYLQALGHMREATVVIVFANVLNAGLNAVLMFGLLGFPALGPLGCALATAACQWFMFGALWWLSRSTIAGFRDGSPLEPLAWGPVARLLVIGVPLGLQFALEVWAFHAAAFLVGRFGQVAFAGHAIAMNVATLSFMLPNGLAAAAATRVGQLVGAGLPWARTAWVAVGLGAGVMAAPALLFTLAPGPLAGLYTHDPGVLAVAATLLPLAGAFQLFDGTQVVCFGALRGAGDIHWPAAANIVGYWALGLPIGAWLAFQGGGGPRGIWAGLVAALAVVAAILLVRLWRVARRGARRVRLEDAN